jgi:hypothetical protein
MACPQPREDYPQYLPPPRAQLVDPDILEGRVASRRESAARDVVNGYARAEQTALGIPPPEPLSPAHATLTPSQKKRLRRKRAAAARSQAPFPLPQDDPRTNQNGVHPTPGREHLPTLCPDEVLAEASYQGQKITLRFKCIVDVWPHTGQPHMLRLASPDPDAQVFAGWWKPEDEHA